MSILFLPLRAPDGDHTCNRECKCWETGICPLQPPAATPALASGWRWEGRAAHPCAVVGDALLQPGNEDALEQGFLSLGACGAEVAAESVES